MIFSETQLTGFDLNNLYYLFATLIIGILGYFIKDLHKLIKSLNTTVQELNTTVTVIRETNEKELQMINNTIADRTRRLSKIEDRLGKYDADITDFYKTFDNQVRTIVQQELRNK